MEMSTGCFYLIGNYDKFVCSFVFFAKAVLKVLHELPEPYREVFYLHVFGEVALVEIAELFGKSPSWAGVTYYRAKQKISDKLKEDGYE